MYIFTKICDAILSIGLGFALCTVIITARNKKLATAAELKEENPAPVVAVLDREHASINKVEEEPTETYYPRYVVNTDIPLDAELQIHAQRMCEEYHVNYFFFLAMCESESSFMPDAIGDSGKSRGLMQINKCNWERYGLDASMVNDNIEIGVRMLAELIEKYNGSFDAVVMAYKGGEAFADEWLARGKRLDACDEVFERTNYYANLGK